MMAALSALLSWLMLPALTVFFGLGVDDVNRPSVQVAPTRAATTRSTIARIHLDAVRPSQRSRSAALALAAHGGFPQTSVPSRYAATFIVVAKDVFVPRL